MSQLNMTIFTFWEQSTNFAHRFVRNGITTAFLRTQVEMQKKKSLSSVLRSARLQRGLTLKNVADAVGVSGPAVSRWEVGLNEPSEKNLSAVCKVLRLPVRATRELAGR